MNAGSMVIDGALRGVAPERSDRQRMEALERANGVRSYRKGLKRDLKAGRASPTVFVQDLPSELETMKVLDALLAIPKVGRVKANKLLMIARIPPSKTLGGLGDRQRRELGVYLRQL